MIVILDNIRSVHNVGSIFRTSDAAGVEKIYLCGTTPTPIDRFGRARTDLAKVALGAETTVPWEYAENTIDVVQKLKQEGTKAFGVEQYEGSIDYASVQYPEQCATAVGGAPQDAVAFIFGNEVGGVSLDVLAECDEVIEIPMKGEKESLNVSVAAGIILFHFV